MSPQDTDDRLATILGPNLEAATQRLIAYVAVAAVVVSLIISLI
ncbi:hypothetical protein GCM10011611_47270 [Aliidongia dinghuensis]|uniref:Uncharacterized protein n=1 Tax=Aliidongia dinghuensis TaxID=1867774 RepID=A0A8J3E5I3_9PROT|nr:hypothetical protein [Aliidongia dinghuensis]GGF35482.1 hypothetical protein GCM10011611_47270 [Aliidongia dinghuensis]